MSAGRTVAAVDLGAESGRVAAIDFDGSRLGVRVAHRFNHAPSVSDGILRWDLDTLRGGVLDGLAALDGGPGRVASVGVDTWGVDYGLYRDDESLVDNPTCYRDPRQIDAMAAALREVGSDELYDATGVQLIPINTVFGLLSDVREHPERLSGARRLLMMPDVFHHLLSGAVTTEYTAASTSGALDMRTGQWATGLLDRLGIPTGLLPELVAPGTDVGAVRGDFGGALRGSRVIVPPAHDTASAVVAVPFREPGSVFISSGTWSLVGVETDRAWVGPAARAANLTNEGGYGGTIRLLRNVMGLWLLQECRRQWAAEGHDLSYGQIAELAEAQPGLVSVVNPDAHEFLAPGDMPERVRQHCARNGMPVPSTIGALARCVIDSLALSYRLVIESITEVTGTAPRSVHIVGGGSQHTLLCQLTADATGLPVHGGPVEATAMGNAAVQLAALGELSGLADIRAAIAASTQVTEYTPRPGRDWASAAAALTDTSSTESKTRRSSQ
ncbi:rhamnulokinase [Pseudonocardia spinosispora]|uniref:rhamnulokinase n=1 Tax=Pseudonocardia spinosispora TaxID=103441 RepID=UPI0003F90B15|nr:rhamnulokinase family protein [Pseudonocardia spinosispora]